MLFQTYYLRRLLGNDWAVPVLTFGAGVQITLDAVPGNMVSWCE
jgi:hypothetical protein